MKVFEQSLTTWDAIVYLEFEFISWDAWLLSYTSFEIIYWEVPIQSYNITLVDSFNNYLMYFIRKILNLLLAESVLSLFTRLCGSLLRALVLAN